MLAIERKRERRSRPSVGLISVVAAGRVQAEDILISMHATVSRVLVAVILYLCVISIKLQTFPLVARATGHSSRACQGQGKRLAAILLLSLKCDV